MTRFKKKPVEVDVIRWDGTEDGPEGVHAIEKAFGCKVNTWHDYMYVQTLEGHIRATAGDYIIRGVRGEVYPCKPQIFEETHEAV